MTISTANPVVYERIGDVAIMTMQFAPHNLVGGVLSRELIEALKTANADGARAVVLKSGLRHFSAGADIGLFENRGARLYSELDLIGVLRAFEELPMPVIASVHGVALGGGFELALACDLIVASASAKFGLVEATLGLHPLMGGIQRLIARAGAARAKEMVMLARRHDATTLERWNVINRVVPDHQLDEVTLSLASELAAGPTIAHAATKRLANLYQSEGMRVADEGMRDVHAPILASDDLASGIAAFHGAGPGSAVFTGH
ncbi:enoyl-CoA hydratase/isomerase family protein [Paraburkholderia sediminicola]|uniref:enoyl-CoA hydratase/isomerase family protein n=1 Tax=Paraburkholderia sediminicola TaxID=458836 RepID=UPI0038BA3A26